MHPTLVPIREVAECLHRRRDDRYGTTCGLLSGWLRNADPELSCVSDVVCGACCGEPIPQSDRMNSVTASLWLERRSHASDQGAATENRMADLDQLAMDALPVVPPVFPSLESLIDTKIDAGVLGQYLEQREPFTLLRYGDGEWYSLLGIAGHNCDGHDFLGDSMGRELSAVLQGVADCSSHHPRLFVGTTRELERTSRTVLSRINGADRIRWATDAVFRLGMMNLKTLRFVRACRAFPGRKLLVGSHYLRPVARALDAHHVVIPSHNCYSRIEDIDRLCRLHESDLILFCASMTSECLIWRLFQHRPDATYIDCGSIFDVMLGYPIRAEYRDWSTVIAEHYAPLFRLYVRTEDAQLS